MALTVGTKQTFDLAKPSPQMSTAGHKKVLICGDGFAKSNVCFVPTVSAIMTPLDTDEPHSHG